MSPASRTRAFGGTLMLRTAGDRSAVAPAVLVYAGAAAILVLAGFIAAFVPARRASRVDPMIVLR